MDMMRKYQNKNFDSVTAEQIKELTLFHLKYERGKDWRSATDFDLLMSFSAAIRDICIDRFIATQRAYVDQDAKRVYYLSMEFLTGKFLQNNLVALGLFEQGAGGAGQSGRGGGEDARAGCGGRAGEWWSGAFGGLLSGLYGHDGNSGLWVWFAL